MTTEKKYIDRILKSEKQINKAVKNVAKRINEKFVNEDEIVFVFVLKGAIMFGTQLLKHINIDSSISFITSKSYHLDKKVSKPKVEFRYDINIKNKNVIIVDDLVDTGETAVNLINIFKKESPKTISVAAIFGKPKRLDLNCDEFYCWEEDPKGFLIGYGLDYDEKFRNLPYIAIIKEDGQN